MADEEHEHESTGLPPEQEERIVDKVVSKVRGVISDLTGSKPVEKPEETEEDTETPPEPTSIKEIEADMESKVREALTKIGADEAHQKEHERLAAMKKEPERQPVQMGKVTRWMWGGEQ